MNQLLSQLRSKIMLIYSSLFTGFSKACLPISCFLLASMSLSFAQPTLVKDINTSQINAGINPAGLVNMNGIVFFSAYDPLYGRELWRSDGTDAGTYIVKDITPGTASSNPENLTVVNGTLFFIANKKQYDIYEEGDSSYELWKSNGTAAGTVKVKELSLEEGDGQFPMLPVKLVSADGTLFFTANNSGGTYELWKSNGTTAGTVPVKLVKAYYNYADYEAELTSAGRVVFFTNNDGANNDELWRTDGTPAGTFKVSPAAPSNHFDKAISSLTNVSGTLYFTAFDDAHGHELWKSNGTVAGTVLVKDIAPGLESDNYPISSSPRNLTNVNGTLYFMAYSSSNVNRLELWKSNGTAAGTVLVKGSFEGGYPNPYPANLANVNGTLFFTAYNSTNGNELWKSNGTAAGTVLVKDIRSGYASSNPLDLTNINGTLFFTSNNGASGVELWKSDGTATGTILVKDITAGSASTILNNLINVNGLLFFHGNSQLWKSNGSEAGTVSIKASSPVVTNPGSNPENLTNVNGTLFFTITSNHPKHHLYKSDGTATGTVFVKDLNARASRLTNANGTLFFVLDIFDENSSLASYQLWKSNGSSEGTTFIKSFNSTNNTISNLVNVNGTLYFTNRNYTTNKEELWKSNGTAAGTVLVKGFDINNAIANLTAVNSTLFFTASGGSTGNELWKSEGTLTGTVLVKDINPGSAGASLDNFINFNGTLYFQSRHPSKGFWKSNGTAAGTVLVNNLGGSDHRYKMINANGTLYFTAYNDTNGNELWKSNGTTSGTLLVKKFGLSDYLYELTNVNGIVYFTSYDEGGSQAKLWKSNGTDAGTIAFREIGASNLVGVGNYLVFTVFAPGGGKLWRSNGTSAGTEQVSDLVTSGGLAPINNTLFFSASDGRIGNELWKYDPGTCTTSTSKDLVVQGSTVCSGSNGSITIKASQAEVSYQAYINNSAVGTAVKGGGDITLTIPAVSLSIGTNVYTLKASGCTVTTLTNKATITVNNCPPSNCTASGSILREYWSNITGTAVSAIPLTKAPTSISQLSSFQAPSNAADNYGQRIRGYICAPASGSYSFYIASDDNSELYLSTDATPANKRKIASVTGWTLSRQWTKFASQKSVAITLQAGRRYYIEALHKDGSSNDNLAVGWVVPNSTTIAVIPGSVLSPFVPSSTARLASEEATEETSITAYPNPFEDKLTLSLTGTEGKVVISVTNVVGKQHLSTTSQVTSTQLELDLSGLKAGIYFIRLQAEDGISKVVKVIKR